MIGVIAKTEEHAWVREFFELFKTPWEFRRAGGQYDVVLCADGEPDRAAADLVLIFGSTALSLDRELGLHPAGVRSKVTVGHDGVRIPILGNCLGFTGTGELPVSGTQDFAVVSRKHDGRQFIRAGFDLFAEARELLTCGQGTEHARVPTLDHLIAMVRGWMIRAGVRFVEIPPVPMGREFIACLTHDVDHPRIRHHKFDHTMLGFLHRATLGSVAGFLGGRLSAGQMLRNWLAVLKLPFVHLGLAEDFWKLTGRYLELEKGFASTFFVVPVKNSPGRSVNRANAAHRATQYEAADIADDLRAISAAGGEVGVHGVDAWLDAASGANERKRVADAAGSATTGVRMHWLCFNEGSPAALEAAGFTFDSTVGYNDCVGFRAGTMQAYRPAHAKELLELPLHIMDTALFYPNYLNLSPGAAATVIDEFIAGAAKFGGALTINWHDRSLAPERQWGGTYVHLLAGLKRANAWCPTARDAVAWFQQRRGAVVEGVEFSGASVRVRAKAGPVAGKTPALRLRIHNATAGAHQDVELNGDVDETIALRG